MATIGVSKPYYGIYGNSGTTVTYTAGGVMGKLTEIGIDISDTGDNNLYADNAIAEAERLFAGGTLTLKPDELSQEISKALLGLKEEAIGTITNVTDEGVKELIYDDDQVTPNVGVGFIIKKQVSGALKWRAVVLTKVMFSIPADAATTQGESIEAGAGAVGHDTARRQHEARMEKGGHLYDRDAGRSLHKGPSRHLRMRARR